MTDAQEVIAQIKRSLWILAGATVALFVAIILIAAFVWNTAETNHSALCSVRADLQSRVEQSKSFLHDHPHGVPGIPASAIKIGLRNQESTVAALSGLNCD